MIGGNVTNLNDDKSAVLRIASALERIADALEKGAHINIDHAHIDEVEGKIRTHEERW
tara:strand:+ start:38785 stop:38958 length:174 start_codon:yes stop_codon:yes gene_type:complete